jgi:hypothetical protein
VIQGKTLEKAEPVLLTWLRLARAVTVRTLAARAARVVRAARAALM